MGEHSGIIDTIQPCEALGCERRRGHHGFHYRILRDADMLIEWNDETGEVIETELR